jgi:hypothetical protein
MLAFWTRVIHAVSGRVTRQEHLLKYPTQVKPGARASYKDRVFEEIRGKRTARRVALL